MRASRWMIGTALAVAACAAPMATEGTTADEPLVGITGSTDQADRDCNVVVRSLSRVSPGPGQYVTNGASWVWSGTVEVSSAAGAAPALMWRGASGAWNVAAGVAATDGSATPGFARYTVTIDHDAPGPSAQAAIDVAAYVPMTGGGRLFDHNRHAGDFDNYALGAPDFAIGAAPTVCPAAAAPRQATLTFTAAFTQTQSGALVPGGQVVVAYDPARLAQCAQTQGGRPQWDVTAWLQFDSGERLSASVRDAAAPFAIPAHARQVALWFEATSVSGCHAYDSNFGANYAFALATPPQWLGLPTNLITRDSSARCGTTDAAGGFSFDTWARQRAVVTNLCFQAYQPGVTDHDNPQLWQQLDTSIHWRLVGANGAATAWATAAVDLDGRQGNNASYAWSWRGVDPFRDFHCPEVPATATADGMGVQIGVEYWIDVNGGALRPAPAAAFTGTFVDYPTNPWRAANCH